MDPGPSGILRRELDYLSLLERFASYPLASLFYTGATRKNSRSACLGRSRANRAKLAHSPSQSNRSQASARACRHRNYSLVARGNRLLSLLKNSRQDSRPPHRLNRKLKLQMRSGFHLTLTTPEGISAQVSPEPRTRSKRPPPKTVVRGA